MELQEVTSPERLQALEETELLDSPPEQQFDRLTDIVCKLLQVPVSLVSLVDKDRQFFKSEQGLPEPWKSMRETPLSHSFCQHVVNRREPLIVENALKDPIVCGNLAIRDLNVIAYLGIPLELPNGMVLGSLCAIKGEPYQWLEQEIQTMTTLADFVMTEISLRHEIKIRRQNEHSLQQSNEALRAFNHMVAHDLKGPMISVISYLDIFRKDFSKNLPKKAEEIFDRVQKSTYFMNQLVHDTSQYAKLVNNRSLLKKEEISLSEVFEIVQNNVHAQVEEKNAQIVYSNKLPMVIGIHSLLIQLFQNLIANSIKYCQEKPCIHIRTKTCDNTVVIEVADNGIGIPEESRKKIFQPYFRLHTQTSYQGSGIGLAICQRIVDFHDGEIACDSNEKKGSSFVVRIPLA